MIRPIIKKLKTTLYYSLLALSVSLPVSLGSAAAAAGSASFSITPGSGTFNVGDYLTVEVRENSGSVQVNYVNPKVTYDTNVLHYESLDTSQSQFPWQGPIAAPNGVVDVPMGIVGGTLSGSQNIVFITFKITGAASASSLSFANTSSISSAVADSSSPSGVKTNEEWNGVATGGTYTFKALQTSTPPSGSSGGGSSTSSGGKSTSTGSSSTAVKKPTVAGASSTPPTTSTVAPVTTSAAPDEGTVLTPTEHMVSIRIVNSKDKAIVGAEVKFNGQTTHTLSDGTASFVGVADGKYTVSVTYKGKTTEQDITVNGQGQSGGDVQNFKVKLASSSAIPTWVIYTGGGLLLLFLLGFFIPRRRHGIGDFAPIQPIQPAVVGNLTKKSEVVKPVQAVQPIAPPVVPTQAPAPTPPSSSAKPIAPGSVFAPQDNNSNKDQQ